MYSMLAYRRARRLLMVPADTYPAPTAPPHGAACSPSVATNIGGTTITVTGTGFVTSWGANCVESVFFGSTHAASFAVVSATSLTAVTPAHSVGAVAVVVNTLGGCLSLPSGVTFVAVSSGNLLSEASGTLTTEAGDRLSKES